MTPLVRKTGTTLGAAVAGSALLLPYVGGFPAAYLMMALTVLLVLWLILARQKLTVGVEGWCLLAAVGLLAVAFAATGSIAYIANFAMLVLAIPLTAAMQANGRSGHVQTIAKLALGGVAVAAVVALYQVVIEGRARAAGYGSDEIWSVVAALTAGWLTLIGRPSAAGCWRQLYLLGPILATLVVLLSGSRGPMLAVPILFAVAFAMLPGHRRALLLLLVVVAGLFYFWPDSSRLSSIATIGGELATGVPLSDGSSDVRKVLLDASWGAFKLSALVGYGWGAFAAATAPFTGVASWGGRPDAFHLHSDPLNFAVAGGIVGLVAYGLILLAPLLGAWRSPADSQQVGRRLGAVVLVASYAACGLTNTLFGFEMHTTLYACLLAVLLGYCRDRPVETLP